MYIYIGPPQLRLICAQGQDSRYVYLISSVELRWQRPRLEIPLPPDILYYKSHHRQCEVLRLFRRSTHTHTLLCRA